MTSLLSTAFVLKSVEVKNWKTFADATLNVAESGLTGIVGPNGSGKSSFVDAILWCLYGYKPTDITQPSFRRRSTDLQKDVTSVKVTFTHAGQTVEVFRKMKGKNSGVTADIFMDGVEQTIKTGTTAQGWITNRLGMDVQGFRTAIVVPQKELDSLVDARPANRREHIEKLAGIEDMNLAVKKAREEENELAKQIKLLPGSLEAVEEAGAFLESLMSELDVVTRLCEDAQHKAGEFQEQVSVIAAKSSESEKTLKVASGVHKEIVDVEHSIDMATSITETLRVQIEAIDADVLDVDITARPSLEAAYRAVNEDYTKVNHELANHTGNVTHAKREIASIANSIDAKAGQLETSKTRLAQGTEYINTLDTQDELSSAKDVLEKEISDSKARKSSLGSLVNDLEESIRVLDSHDHSEAKCPTCHSTLENPDALLEQFRKTVASSQEEITALAATIRDKTTELQTTVANINSRERAEREIASITEAVAAIETEIAVLEQSRVEAAARLTALEDFDVDAAQRKIADLDLSKRRILSNGEKIAAAEKALEKKSSLESELANKEAAITPLTHKLSELEELLGSYGDLSYLELVVAQFAENLGQIRDEYDDAFRASKDLESRKVGLEERVNSARSTFEREEKLSQAKVVALKKLEEKSAVSDLLDEYRKDRIARIAPELSGTATDLISQMTNGRFIEVIVYEDFATAVIKDDGFEYSVYELSGGEKSIVALALRIAIGSLITGENAGLLWLDEVLPAQDAERRDAILGVLRSLPIQQIVMINHTHEAEDVVDQVVKINYDGTGSTIAE